MAKPDPGAGDLVLTLGGEEIVLRCTPACAIMLSRQPGSIAGVGGTDGVIQRVGGLDMDTMAVVIRAGLGLSGNAVPKIDEWIFDFGLTEMRDELRVFISGLINSGTRKAPKDPAPPGEGEPAGDAA